MGNRDRRGGEGEVEGRDQVPGRAHPAPRQLEHSRPEDPEDLVDERHDRGRRYQDGHERDARDVTANHSSHRTGLTLRPFRQGQAATQMGPQEDDRHQEDETAQDDHPGHSVSDGVLRHTGDPGVAPDELHQADDDGRACEERDEDREERDAEQVDREGTPARGICVGPVGNDDHDEDPHDGDQPEEHEHDDTQDRRDERGAPVRDRASVVHENIVEWAQYEVNDRTTPDLVRP